MLKKVPKWDIQVNKCLMSGSCYYFCGGNRFTKLLAVSESQEATKLAKIILIQHVNQKQISLIQ